MKRNQFIKSIGIGTVLIPSAMYSFTNPLQGEPKMNKALVEKFVRVSHGKMDIAKELLKEHPNLINAAYDWGHGDFETALGAASHVGHKELANFLLDNGAQANIFTAALFGRMDILKPMLEFAPNTLNAKGPHGFTLLHHAAKGGEDALEVKEYLLKLGLKETKIPLY